MRDGASTPQLRTRLQEVRKIRETISSLNS